MIGTTRSRVSFFMNRFRKLGFIDYNGRIRVYKSLLNVILHDQLPDDNAEKPPISDISRNSQRFSEHSCSILTSITSRSMGHLPHLSNDLSGKVVYAPSGS